MAITSEDIQNQSFSIDRKGYDVDEVDVFLERVSDEIDALNAYVAELENKLNGQEARDPFEPQTSEGSIDGADMYAAESEMNEQDQRIRELETQLSEKKANDNAISQALIIAQRTADETLAQAQQQADGIIADANVRADEIIARANSTKQEIINETKQLDDDCEAIRGRFQSVLKDFISDASNKLADISDVSIMTSAHARRESYNAELDALKNTPQPTMSATNYITPTFNAAAAQATTSMPTPSPNDRDLSGFGDASVDEFEIDD